MADYYTQTVIHQEIPERLIAPFERLLLAEIFESDRHDDGFIITQAKGRMISSPSIRAFSARRLLSRRKNPVSAPGSNGNLPDALPTFRISISTSQPRPIETAPTSSSSKTSCAGRKTSFPI